MLPTRITFALFALASAQLACSGSDQAIPEPTARPVTVMEITAPTNQVVRVFNGTLRARERAELIFEVAGTVAQLNVDLGDSFRRGDVLARLDDQLIQLDLARREADVNAARASLVEAELDHARRAELLARKAVSRADFDAATARLDRARAHVELSVAAVASAQRRLRDTRMIAPYDGEVAARYIEPSQSIRSGEPVLSVSGSDAGLEAMFSVPERLRSALSPRMRIDIQVKSRGTVFPATVSQIGSRVNAAGLYGVTAAVQATPVWLSPGMIVDVVVMSDAGADHWLVPHTALLSTGIAASDAVYLVDAATDTLRLTPVKVQRLIGDGVVISDGLASGDILVTRGVDFLRDEQAVYPTGLSNGIARYNP